MKKIIILLAGFICCAGSAYCAVRGYMYYSYLQGTGLLFAKTSSAAHIKFYPYFFIAAAILWIIGMVCLIIFNILIQRIRKKKVDEANQAAANALFGTK